MLQGRIQWRFRRPGLLSAKMIRRQRTAGPAVLGDSLEWAVSRMILLAARLTHVLRPTLMALSRLVRRIMPVYAPPEKCPIAALVELDVTSILASCGPALPEETNAVPTPNAAVAHVVLMELAQPYWSQFWNAMGVALGKAKIAAAGTLRTIQIVSSSKVTVKIIAEVIGSSSNPTKIESRMTL